MPQSQIVTIILAAFALTACQSAAPNSSVPTNAQQSAAAPAPVPTTGVIGAPTAAPVPTALVGVAPSAMPAPVPTALVGVAPSAMPAPVPTALVGVAPSGPPAPELAGGGAWINSAPLTLADLRGKVVLVDFWTYGCYNCTNTLPYMKQWWSKYKDQGLVIVGVHTPEFSSERELANVQAAVKREEITWPVVQDNDKTIWRAYQNHAWPHFYLIDHQGQIIYDHIGEGAYNQTDQQIAAALAAAK